LVGDKKVCPPRTKHYSLKAVGPGGEATRSLSIVVMTMAPTATTTTQPQPKPTQAVQQPTQIPPPTQISGSKSPTPTSQESSNNWYVKPDPPPSPNLLEQFFESVLDLISTTVHGASDLEIVPRRDFLDSRECVGYVANVLCRDTLYWLDYEAYAYRWVIMANASRAKEFGVSVHTSPRPGDIAVWGPGCTDNYGSAHAIWGHVAYVTAVHGNTFDVKESNWKGSGQVGERKSITVENCMSFIRNGCQLQWDLINKDGSELSSESDEEKGASTQKTNYPEWLPKFFWPIYDFLRSK
jgi:surface antigen